MLPICYIKHNTHKNGFNDSIQHNAILYTIWFGYTQSNLKCNIYTNFI
jgi:hypothetical protein